MARITENSFVYYLFPFLFDESTYVERAAAVSAAVHRGGTERRPIWSDAPAFPLEAVLCHVRQYLAPAASDPVFRLWKLDEGWHKTYGVGREARWFLETKSPARSLPFELGAAGKRNFAFLLALARTGVGVLTVNARPNGDSPNEWLDFLSFFRFVGGQRGVRLRCERDIFDPATRDKKPEPYFPEGADAAGYGELRDVLRNLLGTAVLPGDSGVWWRQAFVDDQLLPYSATLLEEAEEHEWDELLYRVRNTFPIHRTITPGEAALRHAEPQVLPYARTQSLFYSMDSAGFLALNPPDTDFFRKTLPMHLREQYFFVVLLCVLQRFTLLRLSDLVAQAAAIRPATTAETADTFERARRLLHVFSGTLNFAQVMHSEHHHRAYRACRQAWLLGEMYQEVKDEIQEIHDFHEARRASSLQRKVNWAVVFLAIPGLFLSFLSINWKGFTASEGISIPANWEPLVGAALLFAALGAVLRSILRRQD